MHSALVLAAAALVAAPWVIVARTLMHPKPVRIAGQRASSVVWGDRVFSSRAQLAGWLSSRGASYRRWSSLHPVARSTVEHTARAAFKPPPAARAKTAGTTTTAKERHAAPARQPQRVATTGSGWPWATIVKILLAAIAAAMMLVALVPATQLEFRDIRPLSLDHRTYLFAAGFSILAGVAVGLALA